MRKIIYLVTALMIFITALFITSPKAYASTWNNVYVFDELETTFYGVTLSIEEGTNVFTLNGTSTAGVGQNYTFDDMFTPNSNGSSLSHLKKYVIYYEYISGTMTGSTYVIQSGSSGLKQIQVQQNNYTQNKGYLQTYTETTFHRTSSTSSSQFTNFKYRLHILEFENELQDDDVFFTELSSQGTTVIYTIQDAYTVHLSGSYTTDSPYNLTTKVNSKMLNSDKPILVAYEYVSGTKTGSQSVQVSGADIMQLGEETRAVVAEDITQILIDRGSSGSFTDYTFKLHFQEIELYEEEIAVHTVTFNSFGGSSVTSQQIDDGNLATEPTDPTRTGYTFSHWVISDTSETFDFTTPITSDLSLRAVWIPLPGTLKTIIFMMNGGTPVYEPVTVENGGLLPPPPNPTRPGYDFIEWRVVGTGEVFNFNTPITSDLTLSAVWEGNGATVRQISFSTEGGTSLDPILIEDGDTAIAPSEPLRSGYTFVHWVISGTETVFDFSTPITSNLSLTAIWEESEVYFNIITFIENGGSTMEDQVVNEGEFPVQPEDPTRSGYTFAGWFTDIALTQEYIFVDEPMESDLTLYAKWTPVSGGGDPIDPSPETSSSTWLYIGLGAFVLLAVGGLQAKTKKGKKG